MDIATRHLLENIKRSYTHNPDVMFGKRIVLQLVSEIERLDKLIEEGKETDIPSVE